MTLSSHAVIDYLVWDFKSLPEGELNSIATTTKKSIFTMMFDVFFVRVQFFHGSASSQSHLRVETKRGRDLFPCYRTNERRKTT
jgi:hypothetical protein